MVVSLRNIVLDSVSVRACVSILKSSRLVTLRLRTKRLKITHLWGGKLWFVILKRSNNWPRWPYHNSHKGNHQHQPSESTFVKFFHCIVFINCIKLKFFSKNIRSIWCQRHGWYFFFVVLFTSIHKKYMLIDNIKYILIRWLSQWK